jgi:Tol biopolymer transport system component
VVNTITGITHPVTFIEDADEYNPSFSNNGRYIIHDVLGASVPLGHSLFITEIKSGQSTLLAGGEGGNDASWSPNGRYIAFDRFPVGDSSLYIIPARGGTPMLVRTNAADAEWSNNSKRLVFRDLADGSLRTIDLFGGSETFIVNLGLNPSWSTNGKSIAFSDGNNIFKINVNEFGEPQGNPFQLTYDGAGIYNSQVSWSNNDSSIVFHSNRLSGNYDIWTVPSNGGTPLLLVGDPNYGDYDPCYSKNGKYVGYAGFTLFDIYSHKNLLDKNTSSSAKENSQLITYALSQNYPNPFNPKTVISYQLPATSNVTLKVYDLLGDEVATLINEEKPGGEYEVEFNAASLPSGVYYYQLKAGEYVNTKKMVLLK